MKKLMLEDKIGITLIVILIITFICAVACGEEFKGSYYEKDGCIYLVGEWTESELIRHELNWQKRKEKIDNQVALEIKNMHEQRLAEIDAQAMRDYLIANSLPLREVSAAVRNSNGHNLSVTIGNVSANSHSTSDSQMSYYSEGNKYTNTVNGYGGNSTNTNTVGK